MNSIIGLLFAGVLSFQAAAMAPVVPNMYFCAEYYGAILEDIGEKTYNYASKDESESTINGGLPTYYNGGDYINTCANVAGAIVLGYYDVSYNDLIPNYTSAIVFGDRIVYRVQDDNVQNAIDELYDYMDTNSTSAGGTTISGFKNGLSEYVNKRGRNISYSSLGSGSSFSISGLKNSIAAKKPVVLFTSQYALTSTFGYEVSNGTDKFITYLYSGNHVMVACGIKEIEYYNSSNGLIEEVTLLKVSTGFSQVDISYIFLDDPGIIIDSYSVNIY